MMNFKEHVMEDNLLKVLGDNVVGQVTTKNEIKTAAGFVLPASGNNTVNIEAKVLSVGPDVPESLKDELHEGARIIYNVAHSTEIDYGDQDNKLIIVPYKYIYAVIKKPTENKVTFDNHDSKAIDIISKTLANQMNPR